jgi:hypothetical protein
MSIIEPIESGYLSDVEFEEDYYIAPCASPELNFGFNLGSVFDFGSLSEIGFGTLFDLGLGSDLGSDLGSGLGSEIEFDVESDVDIDIEHGINLEFVPEDEKSKMLDTYVECNCCDIHKINKPLIYSPWVDLVDNKEDDVSRVSNKDANGNAICLCYCRFNARAICRSHPDYKDSLRPKIHN